MKIEALLSRNTIVLNIEPASKSQVIEKMLSIVAHHPAVRNIERLKADVLKREEEMSTGIGKQIALPHAKTSAVMEPVLAFATLSGGINFDAIDNEPVRLVFLLATPEKMLSEHLKLLGRITRLVGRDDVRGRLLNSGTPEEVIDLFREEEKDLPSI